MFHGVKDGQEVFEKAYVSKTCLSNIQVVPVPEDLDNWIEVDFDSEFNYIGKAYNVEKGIFEVCNTLVHEQNLSKRKKAYTLRSDHLFIEYQYDNSSAAEQAWREEVLAIKTEYPIK